MLKQRVGGDVQLILEEIGFQYFPHTQRMLDKKFYLIEIWKFLEFTQGPLQERSSLPLTPHSRIASPHLLPPIVPWRLALWQQLLTRGWQTRMMWRCFFIRPPFLPQAPVQRRSPVPGRVCILLLTASAFPCPAPKHGFEVGTAWRTNETKALGDAPQVPVPSYPRSW